MTCDPSIPNIRMTPVTRADTVCEAMKHATHVKARDAYAFTIQMHFEVKLEEPNTYLRVHLSRVHRSTNEVIQSSYLWDIDTELFGALMMDETIEIGVTRAIRDLFKGEAR